MLTLHPAIVLLEPVRSSGVGTEFPVLVLARFLPAKPIPTSPENAICVTWFTSLARH
ncbi:hypothetical protein SAMN05444158_0760 [Bradyrhizobium canariense]|uniref:Uncharacterized protein n=1 Tax=Bradyrhizobium canariense TaxID=255045 RepID=A0A1H1NU51_9BRAD|nr:hypothetical protein SAMN05444158_0760 [Bradyrhizobium canariense]